MRIVRWWSDLSTKSPSRSRRFRFWSFLVRMWLWFALWRFRRPEAVILNRFAAAFFVFIFGIGSFLPGRSGPRVGARRPRSLGLFRLDLVGRHDHRHLAALE